ncbi:hypothetical protein SH467x_004124 [Pirellulaceae bacterium SH467]|jgi:hypothetical protein
MVKKLVYLPFLGTLLCFGCGPKVDPLVEKAKAILLQEDLSASALSIEQAIGQSTDQATQGQPMVMKAKVGSGKGDTFDPKASEFLVSEIPEGEHAGDEKHDADNCPFCRAREAKAPTVVVRLLEKDGKPFARPADQLFGLKKGQHVVVRGVGTFDAELNFFTVEATGLKISE